MEQPIEEILGLRKDGEAQPPVDNRYSKQALVYYIAWVLFIAISYMGMAIDAHPWVGAAVAATTFLVGLPIWLIGLVVCLIGMIRGERLTWGIPMALLYAAPFFIPWVLSVFS